MNFEWDENKDAANARKHGISFERAIAVFADPMRVTVADDRFDYGEERFITYGQIEGRLFVVVTTWREETQTIRVMSARKANARERRRYANQENDT